MKCTVNIRHQYEPTTKQQRPQRCAKEFCGSGSFRTPKNLRCFALLAALRFSLVATATALVSIRVAYAAEPSPTSASLPPAPPPAKELLAHANPAKPSSDMHPRIVLRDTEGKLVRDSGAAVDVSRTCAPCHDVSWIATHGFHFTGASAPVVLVTRDASAALAPNCFFCHVRRAAFEQARANATADNSRWLATATLVNTGLVMPQPGSAGVGAKSPFAYATDKFASDGSVSADQLQLGPPSNDACGACHGIVSHTGPSLADWQRRPELTERTGQVFSPSRVSDSNLNLTDRDRLTRSWDVHAERLLGCSDCHFTQNDPRARALTPAVPETLRFEPRHGGIGAFLRRPNHDFARGSRQVRCETCHDARPLHAFLPHTERHLGRVGCEVCHIPKSLVPALREVDASLPLSPGRPRLSYRGLVGKFDDPSSLVAGFEPAVLARADASGSSKLTAVNFVTTWQWREGSGARVADSVVESALFEPTGKPKPEVTAALDRDGDGQLQNSEWMLDTDERVSKIAQLLAKAGVHDPRRIGEVQPVPLYHGVVAGKFALRECTSCHAENSRLNGSLPLAENVAPSSKLVYAGDAREVSLALETRDAATVAVAHGVASRRSHYVFGSSRASWLDRAGASLASLVFLGALAHGGLRFRAAQRRRKSR